MLFPDYYYESVFMIPYQELWQKNIRGLIFDLDNTLATYDTARPPAKVTALMRRLKKMGFQVCLLTNNTGKRMRLFNEHLGLPAIPNAMKPFTKGIKRAVAEMGITREEAVIIGDQLFSDIWAGKNAHITTILVKPISHKDMITVGFKRMLERPLLKAYFKKMSEGAAP